MKWWLTFLLLVTATGTALCKPAQVLLLRHAEKPHDHYDADLSERGRERARALVPFFTTNTAFSAMGRPAALFAPRFSAHGRSRRSEETLEPLATHLNLRIQMPFRPKDYGALARRVLKDPALDGKTVIICWVHDYLPQLAAALGIKPTPARWKGKVYDQVWVINYKKHPLTLTSVPQRLLPGDS